MAMDNIPVLGIEEIAFEVKDLDRSVAFYQNVIGLSLYSRGPQQAWFRVGQQSLALFTTDRAGNGQHFAFLIPHERVEQARRALVAQGFPEETMQQVSGVVTSILMELFVYPAIFFICRSRKLQRQPVWPTSEVLTA